MSDDKKLSSHVVFYSSLAYPRGDRKGGDVTF